MDITSASGTPTRQEPMAFFMCASCGCLLPVSVTWRGGRFHSEMILFHHTHCGLLCPRCEPDMSQIPHDDPDTPERCPAIKERAIIEALQTGGKTPLEISIMTGMPRTTIIRRLDAMEKHEQVRKENGKYFIKILSQI